MLIMYDISQNKRNREPCIIRNELIFGTLNNTNSKCN